MKLIFLFLILSSTSLFAQFKKDQFSTQYLVTDTLTVPAKADIKIDESYVSITLSDHGVWLCSEVDKADSIELLNRTWYKSKNGISYISFIRRGAIVDVGVHVPGIKTYFFSSRPLIP